MGGCLPLASLDELPKIHPRPSHFGKGEGRGEGWASCNGRRDHLARTQMQTSFVRARRDGHPSPPSPLPSEGGRARGLVIAACLAVASAGLAHAEGESIGLWIKNTSPVAVAVFVDGAQVCSLEAPLYAPCVDKLTKLTNKKVCSTNNLKISCVTSVSAAGAAIRLKRSDGIEYNVRAGEDANLYLCIEPAGLTDCFGTKLH